MHNELAALATSRDVRGMDRGREQTGCSCILLKGLSVNFRPILKFCIKIVCLKVVLMNGAAAWIWSYSIQ